MRGSVPFISQINRSQPPALSLVFNDQALRRIDFVVVHGGYPFTKEMGSLMSKPNVYADFSAQTFFTYPRESSEILRNWLESYPDKILFGTDARSRSAPKLIGVKSLGSQIRRRVRRSPWRSLE